jgi:hypothetical protein
MAEIFAASLLLQLADKGKIELKNNVTDYGIKDYRLKNASIKNILSHTAQENPGTAFNFDPSYIDSLENVIQACSGVSFSKLLKKRITRKLSMKQTIADNKCISNSCVSSVSDMAKFSMAIDQNRLFENENTKDVMFRPFYLKDGELTPASPGWFVQFYNDKKYAWSFGSGKGFSSLIIKSLTDSLTLVVMANSENLNVPFGLQQGDVFKSPVVVEFLKTFIIRNDSLPNISIHKSDDSIKIELEKCNTSKHRDLLVNEYLSYVRMCQYMNQTERANQLINIYQKALPLDVPWSLIEKKPRAIIKEAGDYINIKRPFNIEKDTTVQVFAVGEFVKEMALNIWEYDAVEMYLDIKNDKKTTFDNKVHRQYRFNYDYPEVTGNFSTAENIKFVQADPSKTSYLFEIRIPWKTLDSIKPLNGVKLGLDMNVSDNDGNGRKNFICWHFQKNQQAWSDPSVYGTILLCDQPQGNANDSLCYSVKTKTPIIIDGKIENEWNRVPRYKLNRTTFEKFPDSKDISACFRSLWDNDYLYFLVEVTDDYKYKFPMGGDFGWIENEKQDTVWIMQMLKSQYAGGAASNRFVNTAIPLKKGNYTLNYKTNQTNSYNHWIGKRPEINFYGIAVY